MKVRSFAYLLIGLSLFALTYKLEAREQKAKPDPWIAAEAFQEPWTITGRITDKKSGEYLKGVLVRMVAERGTNYTESNEQGGYTLTLPPRETALEFFCLGYKTERIVIPYAPQGGRVDVALEPLLYDINDVVVLGERGDIRVRRPDMGLERINSQTIKKIPVPFGEPDIIKAIQLLPGVQSASEGSSGFIVRGGSPDQNLVLFDRATVYNPSHMMGFFSIFNNDAVTDVQLYKGDIPAGYGGRLSSLLEVGGREGTSDFIVSGGIGLIASRLAVSGPIGNNITFLAAARRTYADMLLRLSNDTTINSAVINFHDLNGKMRWRINEQNNVLFTIYSGRDRFGTQGVGFNFGNSIGALSWNHYFSPRLSLITSVSGTMYQYDFKGIMPSLESRWVASIREACVQTDGYYNWNGQTTTKFGWSGTYQWFRPGDASVTFLTNGVRSDYPISMSHRQALTNTLYFSNEHKLLNEQIFLRYGLRLTRFDNVGPTTHYTIDSDFEVAAKDKIPSGKFYHHEYGLEPRIALRYLLNSRMSVKASYSRTLQYAHLLSFSSSGSPLDIWIPSNPSIKPQVANQYAIGFFNGLFHHTFQASVEMFYKGLNHVVDFKDHPNILLYDQVETELRFGSGYAYGTEWMLRKETGDLTGWLSYTWLRSLRTINGVNDGKRYSAPSDRPHNVSIVLSYQLPFYRRLEASVNWIFTTGQPFVMPEGRFLFFGEFIPVYSARNAYRMPDYHRMDLSLIFHLGRSSNRFKNDLNVSVYNLYWRKNPWMINYRLTREGTQYAEMTYLFGIVPSITWNFNF